MSESSCCLVIIDCNHAKTQIFQLHKSDLSVYKLFFPESKKLIMNLNQDREIQIVTSQIRIHFCCGTIITILSFAFRPQMALIYIYMSCSIVIITLLLHFYHIVRHVKIRILGFLTNGKTFAD